jgi:hypothetical protein
MIFEQRTDALTVMTAFYTVQHPSLAVVRFAADADRGLFVSIIHETMLYTYTDGCAQLAVDVDDFLGDEASPVIEVEDKDVLIVLCKRNSRIVASQIFEVDLSAVSLGYLLIPRGGFNLLCDQSEQLRAEDLDKMCQERIYVSVSA